MHQKSYKTGALSCHEIVTFGPYILDFDQNMSDHNPEICTNRATKLKKMLRESAAAEFSPEGEAGSLFNSLFHLAYGFIFASRGLQWPQRYLAILVPCFKPKFILARKGACCKIRLPDAGRRNRVSEELRCFIFKVLN